MKLFQVALENNATTLLPCSRSDLDNLVGNSQHRFLVFDKHHGVSTVTQAFNCHGQLTHILRVQADGRFIENIQHVDETGSECRGKADSASLAAAQCSQRAIEREIAKAYRAQIVQACQQLLSDQAGNLLGML